MTQICPFSQRKEQVANSDNPQPWHINAKIAFLVASVMEPELLRLLWLVVVWVQRC
ncbi:hypothetical protein BVRB_3g050920 [Beta vulgaris subsp. vulgaris]|uniref:Uncharacterized protein n=1 Tax=Beta vulgaris subsp. vulgaris TaxID=3555 RepID=A0A0J8CWJ8_BETVV|nr:hypothetical protein BVRB_3g050920 [Beta vulgaris subsp. vulgaris]